jgi:hypothetical protein
MVRVVDGRPEQGGLRLLPVLVFHVKGRLGDEFLGGVDPGDGFRLRLRLVLPPAHDPRGLEVIFEKIEPDVDVFGRKVPGGFELLHHLPGQREGGCEKRPGGPVPVGASEPEMVARVAGLDLHRLLQFPGRLLPLAEPGVGPREPEADLGVFRIGPGQVPEQDRGLPVFPLPVVFLRLFKSFACGGHSRKEGHQQQKHEGPHRLLPLLP